MTRTWPDDWEERLRGAACPACAEGRPDEAEGRLRIYAGKVVDAYLNRDDAARGYTVVYWRGRHVADPTELDDEAASAFWRELLHVSRALERYYSPAKLNLLLLGNSVPHLHAHVVPRYVDDVDPGRPPRFMMTDGRDWQPLDDALYLREVHALRELLSN